MRRYAVDLFVFSSHSWLLESILAGVFKSASHCWRLLSLTVDLPGALMMSCSVDASRTAGSPTRFPLWSCVLALGSTPEWNTAPCTRQQCQRLPPSPHTFQHFRVLRFNSGSCCNLVLYLSVHQWSIFRCDYWSFGFSLYQLPSALLKVFLCISYHSVLPTCPISFEH